MKFAKSEFQIEEFILCVGMAIFFSWILIGARSFSEASAIFPIMLSAPALLLLAVYMFRGLMPPAFNRIVLSGDAFTLGKKPDGIEPADTTRGRSAFSVYFIFAYTAFFALCAYAFGFYIAAFTAVVVYVLTVRRSMKHPIPATILLSTIALGIIYVFDIAYGFHYGQGVWLSLGPR